MHLHSRESKCECLVRVWYGVVSSTSKNEGAVEIYKYEYKYMLKLNCTRTITFKCNEHHLDSSEKKA